MSRMLRATTNASGPGPLLAFTGQPRDPLTGCYHLGNGHRTYNPVLMRFHSADRLSPFDKGGINAYAYCRNDPVNFHDPSGRFPAWLGPVRSIIGGFLNLGISAVKAYRGYRSREDFRPEAGVAGSRNGDLTFATAENPVSRWTVQDTALTAFGGFSSAVSIGTSIGRMAASDSNALMWVDTAFATFATVLSGYELYTIARTSTVRRYPVSPLNYNRNIRETSV
ncbi:RHS repeat-associated core domain-containing protein [Pseudomonas sp.]|uniref:RHS repeat-associated core domain-containing protein n=1 Tax=Pseudomonas sp. TaxID=306 RepID=UPI0039C9F14E